MLSLFQFQKRRSGNGTKDFWRIVRTDCWRSKDLWKFTHNSFPTETRQSSRRWYSEFSTKITWVVALTRQTLRLLFSSNLRNFSIVSSNCFFPHRGILRERLKIKIRQIKAKKSMFSSFVKKLESQARNDFEGKLEKSYQFPVEPFLI